MAARVENITGAMESIEVSHLDRIVEIENSSHEFPWSRRIFEDCLNAGNDGAMYVEAGVIAGFSMTAFVAGEGHLLNLCVAPEYRGRKLGSYILECVVSEAAARKSEVIFLEVRPSNLVAQTLYERHGFNVVGRRPKYYPARRGREDAIIMARVVTGN